MENIIPSSDLRNRYPEISRISKETHVPFIITVNGRSDGVFLDTETYQKMYKAYIASLLAQAEDDVRNGRIVDMDKAFDEIEKELKLKWDIGLFWPLYFKNH